jgi:CheY-like chemotaxis protein
MAEPEPVLLILDDEPIVTTTIKNYFELKGGFQVVTFQQPAEALAYLGDHAVDLIISDQIMPGMSGLEFFTQVKQVHPEAVRILLTGYAQKEDAIRAINQIGLYQYIEKPWNNDELELIVRNGLERKRLYTSLQSRIGELRIASDEIQRLRNGLVELYLEKSTRGTGEAARELRAAVTTEIRTGTRRLLWAFLAVSLLLLASISYIVYSTFFSIRRETASLRIQLSEIKGQQLNPAEIRRLRTTLAGAQTEEIIAQYEESVCFIQGAYIFRDRETGRILRTSAAGSDTVDLSLESNGPPWQVFYTGTGFLVSAAGDILTNRHVAEPWWADAQAQKVIEAGFRPESRLSVAYFPHRQESYALKVRKVSSTADVALLSVTPDGKLPKPTLLEEAKSTPGSPVVLMGFPLGLESVLALASEKELEQIPNLPNLALDQVARELARRDLMRPLITQGHLSNVTDEVLRYDALSTMGGSGGPLFNRQGKVIGINFAVQAGLPGAAMGLPISHALELMRN